MLFNHDNLFCLLFILSFFCLFIILLKLRPRSFISTPIIAIILPITSDRNKINITNPDPSQLVLMNYFYPTFLATIEPSLYKYRIYLGYARYDKYLSNISFLSKLKNQMKNNSFTLHLVVHNFTRLVDMYNIIAKKAYYDGANYFINMNDDIILRTKKWSTIMIKSLYNNPLLSDFGTTGFQEANWEYSQFNFVSKTHLEIFNKNFYTPVIPNWGIDNWICGIYKEYNSFFMNENLTVINHVEVGGPRYPIDWDFRRKLQIELNESIKIIKSYLDKKGVNYYKRSIKLNK